MIHGCKAATVARREVSIRTGVPVGFSANVTKPPMLCPMMIAGPAVPASSTTAIGSSAHRSSE